jgi:hypothetical protein
VLAEGEHSKINAYRHIISAAGFSLLPPTELHQIRFALKLELMGGIEPPTY